MRETVHFSSGATDLYFGSSFSIIDSIAPQANCIIVTDSRVAGLYGNLLSGYHSIVIPEGEASKVMATALTITDRLIAYEAHRHTLLIGLGGGMITDLTGYVAATYMRGMRCGFVPTTLLAMVDAALGGKNGVNHGLHKNLIGTTRQPEFIVPDTSFLQTLPQEEWSNGFAEVIKYACLFDEALFEQLATTNLSTYQADANTLNNLVKRCCGWKNKIVTADEKETGERKLLNFGHTAGHAIETLYQLPHGQAVAIGMLIACYVSENVAGLDAGFKYRLQQVLAQYGLPTTMTLDADKVTGLLRMDKKRNADDIDYIVLEEAGSGKIMRLPFDEIHKAIKMFSDAVSH